jgi:exopolysaccharide biosynthesis polyprenyl glycosylphosphotransferase
MDDIAYPNDPAAFPGRLSGERAPAHESDRVEDARKSRAWRGALLRRMLALADLASVLLAALSLTLWNAGASQVLFVAALAPVWIVLAKIAGLYDRDQGALRHLTTDETPHLFLWAFSGVVLTTLLSKLVPTATSPPGEVRLLLVAFACAFLLRGLARYLWRHITPAERAVIIGDGALAEAVRRKLELFSDIHVKLVDVDERITAEEPPDQPGALDAFDHVILASDAIDGDSMRRLITLCRRSNVGLSVVPPLNGMFGTAARLNHVADLPVVEYNSRDFSRSTRLLKRALDISVSTVALILAMPFLALVAVAIKLDSPGPVFFTQWRAGLDGRPFRMIKFRTMVVNAESLLDELINLDDLSEPVFKLEHDPRVTRTGRFLRRSSIDELPQLINVLRGEMSLVGPRPEQVELVARYDVEARFRFHVKPGITGPMQVYGRGALSFEERLAVEREYVENMSFARDLRLLALTLPAVLGGRGAS